MSARLEYMKKTRYTKNVDPVSPLVQTSRSVNSDFLDIEIFFSFLDLDWETNSQSLHGYAIAFFSHVIDIEIIKTN